MVSSTLHLDERDIAGFENVDVAEGLKIVKWYEEFSVC